MNTTENIENKFLDVLENHKNLIIKIAKSYSRSNQDQEDLIQEIVLQLWKSFPKYNPAFAFSTWIYRIALNVSISFYRKESNRKKIHVDTFKWISYASSSDNEVKENPKVNQLYQFIDQLNELEKAVMLLYLDEKSHKEIAEIIGISKTNVGTRINRIKIKLKHHFQSNNI